MNHGWIRLTLACLWLHIGGLAVHAQMLAGDWVRQSEQRIDELRKTDLRVIVMGADGRPVSDADVWIEQTRSDFHVGVVLPETGWTYQDGAWEADAPFWRCVNAVSLQRMTGWPVLEPERSGSLDADRLRLIDRTLEIADGRGLFVRWGPLVSADPGRVPGWAAALKGEDLAGAVNAYCDTIWRRYDGRVGQYDVYTQTLDHNFIEARSGLAQIRRMYEALPVRAGGASACARFDDALMITRLQKMQRQLTAMREAFIPVDCVAVEHHFNGVMERPTLERLINKLDSIDRPVVVCGLTVGGDNAVNAAISLEMVLRTLMERQNLRGVWLAGLTPDDAVDPNSALLDENGELTASGSLVDSLYHDLWRTHLHAKADELGNVRARAFPGDYRVTATLADGTELQTELRLEMSLEPRVVLLEPRRPAR